MHVGQFLPNTF